LWLAFESGRAAEESPRHVWQYTLSRSSLSPHVFVTLQMESRMSRSCFTGRMSRGPGIGTVQPAKRCWAWIILPGRMTGGACKTLSGSCLFYHAHKTRVKLIVVCCSSSAPQQPPLPGLAAVLPTSQLHSHQRQAGLRHIQNAAYTPRR
jgi:hypothetical protein